MRNGNAYGEMMPIEGKKNQVLISDGKEWAEPSQFVTRPWKEAELKAELNGGQTGVKIYATNTVDGKEIEFGSITASETGVIQSIGNSTASFTDNTRFTMTDMSITDIGHGTIMHIYDNVYIDIDGCNGTDSTPKSLQKDTDHTYSGGGKHMIVGDFTLGETNPWSKKQHNTMTGPTFLVHGSPYVTLDNSGLGAPAFQLDGLSHFLISDGVKASSGGNNEVWTRWTSSYMRNVAPHGNGKSTAFSGGDTGYNGIANGPIVHFTGSPTIDITRAPYIKITDNAALLIQEHAGVHLSDFAILEMNGNSDVRFHDDAEFEMEEKAYFKMDTTAVLEMGKKTEKGQIFLSVGGEIRNAPKESGIISGSYPDTKNIMDKIKNYAWTESDNSPKLLVQGQTAISLGSSKGHDIIKLGTEGGTSYWNITPQGNTYVKFGGASGSDFIADITPAESSKTHIKFGANPNGNMEIYMTGSIFKQMSGSSHFEMHNKSTSIMRGMFDEKQYTPWRDQTKTKRLLSADESAHEWKGSSQEAYEQQSPSPLHAMYDAPTFVMRGYWKDSYTINGKEETKPEGWTGRATAVNGNPLFEMIESSKIVAEGTGSIVIDSDGITINGIRFTNERLRDLAG